MTQTQGTVVRCLDSYELADGTVRYCWTRWVVSPMGERRCLGLDFDVQGAR